MGWYSRYYYSDSEGRGGGLPSADVVDACMECR